MSLQSIYKEAVDKNENGYKTHTGGKFTSTIVNRILKDRFYCGYQEDGQTTYQADRVDEIIRQIIRQIFSCISGAPEEETGH